MKRISLIMGIIFLLLYVNTAYGKPVKPIKKAPGCQSNLEMCTGDLGTCEGNLNMRTGELGICDIDLSDCNMEL